MKFYKGDVVLHKNGNEYKIISDTCVIEKDMVPAYAYSAGSDILWVRPKIEMEDGRFQLVIKSEVEMIILLRAKQALRLEVKGIKTRNKPSVYIQAKRMLNLKGDKQVVLAALEEYIDKCQVDRMRTQI
jgi:hypothetical protein